MKFNILFGGKAGQGPNILSDIVSHGLIHKGYYVFYSREYQSLIRGGHNYNLVSFSDKPIMSNHNGIDLLVALDENTESAHKKELNPGSIILAGNLPNMHFAGAIFKILGIEFSILEHELNQLKRFEENLRVARRGYHGEKRQLNMPLLPKKQLLFMNGNQAIASGAIESGLDVYYAYPMTPATGVLIDLSQSQLNKKNHHLVLELENEISVINAAIGSSIAGAKSMCGTSGGGFDLMTEALSLTGQAEIPLVVYLAQRPGPSTGLPTYTGQSDFNVALYGGHGEFSRVVIAPGDAKESIKSISEAFYLSQKYKIPVILLGDKHLAESKYCLDSYPKIMHSKKSIESPMKFSSYEHTKKGISTEDTILINKAIEARLRKKEEIKKEIEKMDSFQIYGNKNSKNLIIGWGSTKGAIIDAISNSGINCKFIQIIYLEPFSERITQEIKKYKPENIIIIENNATSPLSDVVAGKTQIIIPDKNKILKYDGRPFFSDELAEEIKRRLK